MAGLFAAVCAVLMLILGLIAIVAFFVWVGRAAPTEFLIIAICALGFGLFAQLGEWFISLRRDS